MAWASSSTTSCQAIAEQPRLRAAACRRWSPPRPTPPSAARRIRRPIASSSSVGVSDGWTRRPTQRRREARHLRLPVGQQRRRQHQQAGGASARPCVCRARSAAAGPAPGSSCPAPCRRPGRPQPQPGQEPQPVHAGLLVRPQLRLQVRPRDHLLPSLAGSRSLARISPSHSPARRTTIGALRRGSGSSPSSSAGRPPGGASPR